MDVVTQPSVRGRGNRWRLTIIPFHLFRFPAPPYQPAASSVIRHKDTIATIRGCAEARGDRNVLFVWNVFLPLPLFGRARCQTLWLKKKMDFFFIFYVLLGLIYLQMGVDFKMGELQKGHRAFGILPSQALQLMGNTGDVEGHQNHHRENQRQHNCMSQP